MFQRTLFIFAASLLIGTLSAQSEFITKTALFGDLAARQIGPAVMSGRVSCIAVDPVNHEVMYIGAAGGGIWKTESAGGTLRPVFDDHTQSIGSIAIATSNPKIVWVGTGEPWPRNSVSIGTGVYKSTDAGQSWKAMGLENTERIADVIVHPTNPDIVYVAALGHLWNANEERGVFKTTDGGTSWKKVLYLDENTGAADLSLDVNNPEVLYAAMWSFRRRPWTFDSGFTGTSGLYKTTDGGANWKELKNGIPAEKLGRIAVAVAPSNSNTVYATIETGTEKTKGFYRSTDAGASWKMTDQNFNTYVRPFYFSDLEIDPSNDSIVAKCGLNGIISETAGESFRTMDPAAHSDFHDVWISPTNGKHIRIATDGGVYESFDRGATFKMWNNLPVSQFYHVSVDMAKPYRVYGGLQDNGSWFAPSQSPGGITNANWQKTYGGDGFYSFRHPTQTNIVFSEYQGGNLVRFDEKTRQAKSISPYATKGEDKLRFNWNTPIHLSQNGERFYIGAQYLFRSTDLGDSWERISPDLTTNNPDYQQQHLSGGLSIDNSTAENYTTIYTIAESIHDQNTIWTGSDDGLLHVTTDGGKNWANVTKNITDLPANPWITFIEVSPHDAKTVFVTFDAHRNGDMGTYLYQTTDNGQTWRRINSEEFAGYALSFRQDLVNPDLLFLGTEFGLYISLDGGSSWAPFRNNVPQVGIRDMVIHPRDHDLVMGTHGRGVIILDDLEFLRQITPKVMEEKITFLTPQPTYLSDGGGVAMGDFSGSGNFTGANPTEAARIVYFSQKRHTFGKMNVEVFKDGELIKDLFPGKSAGINVLVLPTRLPKPKTAPTRNRTALFGVTAGPSLPAGTYDVKMTKGKDVFTTQFTLSADPDSPYTVEEREAQRLAQTDLYTAHENVAWFYEVLSKIASYDLNTDQKVPKRLAEDWKILTNKAKAMRSALASLEGDGYVDETTQLREELGNLYYAIGGYPGKPSESQLMELERLNAEVAKVATELDNLLAGPVAELNKMLAQRDLALIQWPDKATFLAGDDDDSEAESGGLLRQYYLKDKGLLRALQLMQMR